MTMFVKIVIHSNATKCVWSDYYLITMLAIVSITKSIIEQKQKQSLTDIK